MAKKFADTIYETPSNSENNWGETVVADGKRMDEVIESLKELGEDWERCEIGDCTEYDLIRDLGNGNALYEGGWHTDGYNRNGRYSGVVFTHETENGFYKEVESYDSVAEFERENASEK